MILYKVGSNYSNSRTYRNIPKRKNHHMMNDKEIKGRYGEDLIFNILKNIDGKIIRNLYLYKVSDGVTEIDLILINPKGIFVIESKNYSGRIYGSIDSPYWMQILGNNKRYRFNNPVFQNRTHINAIRNVLKNVKEKDIYSIIVFGERCNIDNVNVSSENVRVIKRNSLKSTIEEIINDNYIKFIDEEITDLHSKLISYSNVSEVEKQQHIKDIKEKYSNN